jgi:tetratricopeptide (TPR) repeat protein
MTKAIVGGLLVALSAVAVTPTQGSAQTDGVASRVIGSLPARNTPPDCKLDGSGDFRVSSAKVYLRTGVEGTGDAANKVTALKNGARVLNEAITTAGQNKNPAAWYYLGRINLQQGDVVGADSSFTRAEALTAACKADIRTYRYRVWAALINGGQTLRQSGQADSSLMMLRAANTIMAAQPMGYLLLAEHYTDAKQVDSATAYFGKAANSDPPVTDTLQIKYRNQAGFNYGVLLLEQNRSADAVAAFQRYLKFQPDDLEGKKGIAQAFRKSGQLDSAQFYERAIASAPSAGGGTAGGASEADLFDIAVKQFADKDYKSAAETFSRITTQNPNNRDALFNLANAYLALNDGPNLSKTAELLIAIEPLNENDHKLRVQGYKTAKNIDMQYKAVVGLVALPIDVRVTELNVTPSGATISASATGREALDEANKVLPARPITLTFELLDRTGKVVGTADATVPALKAGETHAISANASAAGVTSWRYKTK